MELPQKPLNAQYSLKNCCKNRIKQLFDSLHQKNKHVTSFVLIADETSVKIISSILKMSELLEFNILVVEKLEFQRNPYPKQHAIYFLTPCSSSVQRLTNDFANKKEPMYGTLHIFFTNRISSTLMKQISANQFLLEKIKTFQEFNLDFSCKYDNVFTMDMPEALPKLFSEQNQAAQLKDMLDTIGDKLATVATSFEKYYSFEILYHKSITKLPEQVALALQNRINEIIQSYKNNKEVETDILDPNSGKVTLMIVDRSFDPLAPLVRDFFYQPMLYDLLSVENDMITYEQEDKKSQVKKKTAQLQDSDEVFYRYRYRHIAEALEGIPQEFKAFINNNTTAKMQKGELYNLDLEKMTEIVRSLPQYQEQLNKYTMHMKLIDQCWKIFENKDLNAIGEIEQTLSTGLDESGKDVSQKKILVQICSRIESPKLDQLDKVRLVMITAISLVLDEKTRRDLTDKIDLQYQKAVRNLIWLGINPQNADRKKNKSKQRVSKETQSMAKQKLSKATLNLCRNTPVIEYTTEQLLATGIDGPAKAPPDFESIKINMGEGLKKDSNKSLKKKNLALALGNVDDQNDQVNNQSKLIVFFIGGVGYNEIRCIRNLQTNKDNVQIVVGGTSFLKPVDVINGLLQMKDV